LDGQDNLTEDAVGAMVQALAHRGPDDRGLHSIDCGESVVRLGEYAAFHSRPIRRRTSAMRIPGPTNWIAYNGEVYNFREIRRGWNPAARALSRRTDTEVVLKAYAEFGPACVAHFRGMLLWPSGMRAGKSCLSAATAWD